MQHWISWEQMNNVLQGTFCFSFPRKIVSSSASVVLWNNWGQKKYHWISSEKVVFLRMYRQLLLHAANERSASVHTIQIKSVLYMHKWWSFCCFLCVSNWLYLLCTYVFTRIIRVRSAWITGQFTVILFVN